MLNYQRVHGCTLWILRWAKGKTWKKDEARNLSFVDDV